jgi:hypothetical protein
MNCSREYRALSSALHLSTASPCLPWTLIHPLTGSPMSSTVRCSCAFPSFFWSRIWASASASRREGMRARAFVCARADMPRPSARWRYSPSHVHFSAVHALACRLGHGYDTAGIPRAAQAATHPLPCRCSVAPLSQGFRWLGTPTGRATQSARTAPHHVAAGTYQQPAAESMYIDGGCGSCALRRVWGLAWCGCTCRQDDAMCVCVCSTPEERDSE